MLMKTQPSDTHPDIERMQVRLLRQAGPCRRLELARSLSQSTMEMSLSALRRRHPGLPDREYSLMLLSLTCGEDLARRVRAYLANRTTS